MLIYRIKKLIKKVTPRFVLDFYHLVLAAGAACWFGFPTDKMIMIGVTGTKGKSTVVHLITQILRGANIKAAAISSANFVIAQTTQPNTLKMTMPGRGFIQRFFKRALVDGCTHGILEVTSEGIRQYRHRFINFKIGIFTNLAPEHLETHGSFAAYKKAKGELFKQLSPREGVSIINLDDPHAADFLNFAVAEKYGYSIGGQNKSPATNLELIQADNIRLTANGSYFEVAGERFFLPLLGKFNVYNALAAVSCCSVLGLSLSAIRGILEGVEPIAGRMETVLNQPMVIVDYAHTPDSLGQIYQTIKELKSSEAKIIGVLGSAGGGRDKWKRPEMGRIAAQYCNYIILTNEDPYDEDPQQILSEIKSGIVDSQFPTANLHEILDRRMAIKRSLELAGEKDIVIITGKGSEMWMCLADGKKIPWGEKQVVLEEFGKIHPAKSLLRVTLSGTNLFGGIKYEILEHTADLKIKVYGQDLTELFTNAVRALAEQQMVEGSERSACDVETIELAAKDLESLLFSWLAEIIYRSDANDKIYDRVEINNLSTKPVYLRAVIGGCIVTQKKMDIKAVTYHNLKINQTATGYEATIVFDI